MRPGSGARCCNAVFLSEPTLPPPRPLSSLPCACASAQTCASAHTCYPTDTRALSFALFAAPQYAFNLFSHTTAIGANGYNEEEMKLVKETRKIWGVRAACSLLALCCAALRCAASVGFLARDADDDYISPITDLNRGLGRWRHTLCTTLTLSLRKLAARGARAHASALQSASEFFSVFSVFSTVCFCETGRGR
jgi:hypothetical protein